MIGSDLARYLYWVHLREVFDPTDPDSLKVAASALGKAYRRASKRSRLLMIDELRRTFQPSCGELVGEPWTESTLHQLMRDAYDLQAQVQLEELLLGRMTPSALAGWLRAEGEAHLDAALDHGGGVVLVFPKAGNLRLMSAWLAYTVDYAQVLPRPPGGDEEADSWLGRRARERREADESALPGRWIHLDDEPDVPARVLRDDVVLGWPLDGRAGEDFLPMQFLGRPAWLPAGPWRLAVARGVPVVAAHCERGPDRTHRVVLAAPTLPGPDETPAALASRVCRQHVEPWLRAHPEHYAPWLALCRQRACADPRPLFTDYPELGT